MSKYTNRLNKQTPLREDNNDLDVINADILSLTDYNENGKKNNSFNR